MRAAQRFVFVVCSHRSYIKKQGKKKTLSKARATVQKQNNVIFLSKKKNQILTNEVQ
jgi:hypothetical protein